MPNHVKNRLVFSGEQSEIDKLVESFSSEKEGQNEPYFPDFNLLIPQPKNIFRGVLGEYERRQCLKEGRPNWYDWNLEHWGTKWNSYSNENTEQNTFFFDTAWAPVPYIVKVMSEKFQNVEISYCWADENTGYNCGRAVYKSGEKKSEFMPNGGSRDAYYIAFDIRPHQRDYYRMENGEYVYSEEE